jgi:S-DNA-T family DNA segregation ATPase FtsK/SpoIIIE
VTGLRTPRAAPERVRASITVVDTATSEQVDVLVALDAASPAAALEAAVASALQARQGGLWLGASRLTGPVGSSGLRSGCVLGLGGPLPVPSLRPAVEVITGVDAGAVHPLHADVALGVAVLHPGPAGVVVTRSQGPSCVLRPGVDVDIGDRVLRLIDQPAPDAAARGLSTEVTRPPRLRPRHDVTVLRAPDPPAPAPVRRLPLVPLLLPVAAGLVMAVLSSPLFLLFTLLSPLMALSTWWSDRAQARRSDGRAREDYDAKVAEVAAAEEALRVAEWESRREDHPDPAALAILVGGPRLWERRRGDDDFLVLRLGTGEAAPTSYQLEPGSPRPLEDVPVTVPLREVGVLGVVRRDLARWLVAQAAVLHGPRDLGIWLLVDPAREPSEPDWGWLRWLPHSAGPHAVLVGNSGESLAMRVAELTRLLAERTAALRDVRTQLRPADVLVVLDGAKALRTVAGLSAVLQQGPAVGIHVLCVEAAELLLPEECQAVVGTGVLRQHGCEPLGFEPDRTTPLWATALARRLAPLRDAGAEGEVELPRSARLLDVLGLDPPTPEGVRARWGCTTAAAVGVDADGPVVLDLQRDGPHVLVAGTTGAGKSELLQTLVASLAVANHPDAMTFVLIDYKGGAAFRDCARLPHTVGLVTDLDSHLVERALVSLTAELRRREQLLDEAGVKDIDELRGGGRRLARLVIVIDEFASLVEELPDFVRGLVGIAQRGRSLGVHLVLATQRPSGVVSPEIRANTNLRIALRVTDATESLDVIGAPDAAAIPLGLPGRAFARSGSLRPFQCARVGGRGHGTAEPLQVVRLPWSRAGEPLLPEPEPHDAATDLHALVEAARAAASGLQLPPSPWLEPLPELLAASELDPPRPLLLPYGLEDLPAEQRRRTVALDLERGGHLLVVGTARSGRTTLLRTLTSSLCGATSPGDVHLYAIDAGSGGLAELAELPCTGAVVTRQEPDRVARLLARLTAEVARRQELLAASGWSDLAEQRASAPEPLPYLLLLVDRWEGFTAAFEDIDAGRLPDMLLRLLREGLSAGLRAVVTGDRTALVGRLPHAIEDTVVLRLADRRDYALAGLPPRALPDVIGDGRGFRAGRELQVALPAPLASADVDPAGADAERTLRPFRIDALPARLTWAEARALPAEPGTGVGVGGDELALLAIDLREHGPGFTVAGPPRSGRSTVLVGLAAGLLSAGSAVCALTPRPSPLRQLDGAAQAHAADELARWLNSATGPAAVVVDDAELLVDDPVADVLSQVLRDGRETGHALVIAGSLEDLAGCYRGFAADVRRCRSGVLLGLTSHLDGELLGVRLPRSAASPGPLGRGLLIRNGQPSRVQIPY